jgi:FSR family fosmidomycin resistance protein-like MFS transporter
MNRRAIALLSTGHFLIDFCQGVVPALLPFLVAERGFSYTAAAGLVFALSATSSVVQPLFGQLADRLGMPWLLPVSIVLTGAGLALGAQASHFGVVLVMFAISGLGVAAFHPEAARKAHLASGDRRTTGMSYFSVGGGLGFALAPTLTTAATVSLGTGGLLALLIPTGIIAALLVQSRSLKPPGAHRTSLGGPSLTGRDDWRAFGILSGATIFRSIVFYGLNTFLALYFMTKWDLAPAAASRALGVFLGTSIVGTLLGGWLADRAGRRVVIRMGFTGAVFFLALFVVTSDRTMAMCLLGPLAVFIFMPTSVLVVLGQEYLPQRIGVASGVTLGLAVSVGGMVAPLLGRLGDIYGLQTVLVTLLGFLVLAAGQAFALPPVGGRRHRDTRFAVSVVAAQQSAQDDRRYEHQASLD